MTEFSPDNAFEALARVLKENSPNADLDRIRGAFDFAVKAHDGQMRRDGTPYVTHTIAAATIAAEMGLDDESVMAALLHDTLEDTDTTHDQLEAEFGADVADIVEGVTKLTRVQYSTMEEAQMENLRKMLMAMAKDIRVILIKLADRLHNMRTMSFQSPEKQLSKSRETMEIYAPIAHRLGVEKMKDELEDLALLYLDPVGYQEITNILDKRRDTLEKFQASTSAATACASSSPTCRTTSLSSTTTPTSSCRTVPSVSSGFATTSSSSSRPAASTAPRSSASASAS